MAWRRRWTATTGVRRIVARKVEIKAKLSPTGVGRVVSNNWDFFQMVTDRRWHDDTNNPVCRTNEIDAAFNAATLQDQTPDSHDEIFALDAPTQILEYGAETRKRNSNFRVIARWNVEITSDPKEWWVRQKVERQGTNDGYITIENQSGNGTTTLDENY